MLVAAVSVIPALAPAHPSPVGIVEVDGWSPDKVSRVVSAGYPDSLGLYAFPRRGFPRIEVIDGESCVVASALMLDVDDGYAFDIDETVELALVFYRPGTRGFSYSYDRSALAEPVGRIEIPDDGPVWHRETILLERARFANRGLAHTDLIFVSSGALLPVRDDASNVFTLCDVKLTRSHTTESDLTYGDLDLRFLEAESERPTAVRIGMYDATGRAVLPDSDAVPIKVYDDPVKSVVLRNVTPNAPFWPVENRYVFYADGRYRSSLPVGTYEVVVSKGPEFAIVHERIEVTHAGMTKRTISLERWAKPQDDGWYSGDVHIHVTRNARDNDAVAAFMSAEDVHVSNLLASSNPARRHFDQYAWGRRGRYRVGETHSMVPGIEGPRTAHAGHVISINIARPLDDQLDYFDYGAAFEGYGAQGALSGFAHVGLNEFGEWRGLALEMPFGTVDFVEVMQFNALHTEIWYDFLNLGYRLTPVAGSDFPYFGKPGGERTYVKVDGAFTPDRWFDGLRKGRAFVTNGPLLTFFANDATMGDTLRTRVGERVDVAASVSVNPDIDSLDRLELVKNGDVIATTAATADDHELRLEHTVTVSNGAWLAVRAYGRERGLAHSTPIYVHAGEEGSWSREKAPAVLERVVGWLDALAEAPLEVERELEFWEIDNLPALWEAQKPQVLERIERARASYRALAEQIQSESLH